MSDDSRVLVEARIVRRSSGPGKLSRFERCSEYKFIRLEVGNFFATITKPEGPPDRLLTRNELEREFRKFFAEHDHEEVQHLIDVHSYDPLPSKRICFGGWKLTVELWPASPAAMSPNQGPVNPWSQDETDDPSVRHVQVKVPHKQRQYGRSDDRLILAVNVHACEFISTVHGKDALFGPDGIWNAQRGIVKLTGCGDTNSPYRVISHSFTAHILGVSQLLIH